MRPLRVLVADDDEAERLVATHLEALDDALIISAERLPGERTSMTT